MRLMTGLSAVALMLVASTAHAGIDEWLAAASAKGAGYTNTGIASPIQDDIGTFDAATNGGVTYEFVYNADVGGASSAFMGSLSAPAGDSAGLKLEQWQNTGTFGRDGFWCCRFHGCHALRLELRCARRLRRRRHRHGPVCQRCVCRKDSRCLVFVVGIDGYRSRVQPWK